MNSQGGRLLLRWRDFAIIPLGLDLDLDLDLEQILPGAERLVAGTGHDADLQGVFVVEPCPERVEIPVSLVMDRVHVSGTVDGDQKHAWCWVRQEIY